MKKTLKISVLKSIDERKKWQENLMITRKMQ